MENSIIDTAAFLNLRDSIGSEFMTELVNTYLADAPMQIKAMRAALEAADAEVFRRAAHSLKSTSLNFGAIELGEQARALEYLGRENRLREVGNALEDIEGLFMLVSEELMRLQNG
jgi:HPt (histidine-containing phosphotransfer) domain-containing protein